MKIVFKDVRTYMDNNLCSVFEACKQLGLTEVEAEQLIGNEAWKTLASEVLEELLENIPEQISISKNIYHLDDSKAEEEAILHSLSTIYGRFQLSLPEIIYVLECCSHESVPYLEECLHKHVNKWIDRMYKGLSEFKTKNRFISVYDE